VTASYFTTRPTSGPSYTTSVDATASCSAWRGKDADLDAGELALAWQLQRVGAKLVRRETKTDSSDFTLPLPDVCVAALRAHRDKTRNRLVVVGPDWMGNEPIFTSGFGTPM
jgi:hypothetical protein